MSSAENKSSLTERLAELELWLQEATGAQGAKVTSAAPLSGGAIQENWRLSLTLDGGPQSGSHEVVLRTDAASSVDVSLSRAQEFALLQAAREAGVTVPEPLWLCEDRKVLGKPFYVMRFLPGVALGPKVVKDQSLGGDREALAERLGREMALIHSIRPPNPSLTWCERNAPEASDVLTLVHQDFRTGNYLIDEKGLVAILDWEFCAWGDPMSDLGWFLAECWRFGRPDLEAGGIGSGDAFYRGYRAATDIQINEEAVAYWEVMAHIRWAVIALQQGARHHSGAESSLELALTGRLIAPLERSILVMTPPERWS